MHRSPHPPSHPHLADTAGVIEAVTDGVVVLFPAGALGRQQHVYGIQAVQTPGRERGRQGSAHPLFNREPRPAGRRLPKTMQQPRGNGTAVSQGKAGGFKQREKELPPLGDPIKAVADSLHLSCPLWPQGGRIYLHLSVLNWRPCNLV